MTRKNTARNAGSAAPQPRPRRQPAANGPSTTDIADPALIVASTTGDKIELGAEVSMEPTQEMCTAVVPAAYKLTLDDRTEVNYEAGVQEMPVHHAAHWFSRAQGVKVYQPTKK